MEQGGAGGLEGKSLDEIDFELYKDSPNSGKYCCAVHRFNFTKKQ